MPSWLLRPLQHLKDRHHWYKEIHWVDITRLALPFYREVVDIVAATPSLRFACFVADRRVADPVRRFGSRWTAYEKLAEQLIVGAIRRDELLSVLADEYSTPAEERFEQNVREGVNGRLGRLAVVNVCRLDSKSALPLQVADLLTSAVAFEFRERLGLAGSTSPKAQLAEYVRESLGVSSFVNGVSTSRVRVAIYEDGRR